MIALDEYFPFWSKLSSAEQEALISAAREKQVSKGGILHNGSADCTGLLIVKSGQLRAYTISDEGKELTLYRLYERDICLFSASCIISSIQFDVFIAAEQDSTIIHIPAETYKQIMENSLPAANYTNQLMASRFSDVMWLLDQVLNKKLDSRLAALLLEERELYDDDNLPVTHEDLANHLGSVREVITRMLKHFQNEGWVKLARGHIFLTNIPQLTELAADSIR